MQMEACFDTFNFERCYQLIQIGRCAVKCILQWATARKCASCPTCKKPFEALLVHRDVDGSLSDAPIDMTIGFLARSPWYVAWAAERSQINELTRSHAVFRSVEMAQSARSPLAIAQEEWADEALYGYFEDQYDDDEIEDYYMSSSPARGRTTFGNRPWGPGGYVASGRRRAQPVQPKKGKGVPAKGRADGASGSGGSKASGGAGGSGDAGAAGASQPQQGRRARRKAKQAAVDREA